MDEDLKHDIILIAVSFSVTIIALCVIFIPHNKSNLKQKTNDNKVENKNINNTDKNDIKIYTCTSNADLAANSTTVTIEYDNDNKVQKITNVLKIDSNSEQMTKAFIESFENGYKNLDGVSSNYSNLKWTQVFDFSKLNIDNYKKGTISYMKNTLNLSEEDVKFEYIQDDYIDLKAYVSDQLNDYTCK